MYYIDSDSFWTCDHITDVMIILPMYKILYTPNILLAIPWNSRKDPNHQKICLACKNIKIYILLHIPEKCPNEPRCLQTVNPSWPVLHLKKNWLFQILFHSFNCNCHFTPLFSDWIRTDYIDIRQQNPAAKGGDWEEQTGGDSTPWGGYRDDRPFIQTATSVLLGGAGDRGYTIYTGGCPQTRSHRYRNISQGEKCFVRLQNFFFRI